MQKQLEQTLTEIAIRFADSILQAVRSAPFGELKAEIQNAPTARTPAAGRSKSVAKAPVRGAKEVPAARKTARKGGRGGSATAEDVLALLRQHPEGMRAEQLKGALGVDRTVLSPLLAEVVSSRRAIKKGQARATTYFVR